jgi:hypothetical protein
MRILSSFLHNFSDFFFQNLDSVRAPTQARSDFSWDRSCSRARLVRHPGFSHPDLVFFLLDFGLRFSHYVHDSCLCSGLFVCCVPVPSASGEFVTTTIFFGNCLLLCSCSFSFCLVNPYHRSEVLPKFIFWISILVCRNSASRVDLPKLASSLNSFVLSFGLLQVRVGIVLEVPDQGLELFRFSLYSWGGFSVTHTKCSVKYA